MVLVARASLGVPGATPGTSQHKASYDPRISRPLVPQQCTGASLGWSIATDGFDLALTRKLNSNSFTSWSKDKTERGFNWLYIWGGPRSVRDRLVLDLLDERGYPERAFSPLFFGSVELLLGFIQPMVNLA
ncbi:hypothetical protein B296_00054271 [Ensete ventricosum]|uniref:Uncharacterized protein n=1 Tax=Ensete ventricosum TaxID=4639 RepID=A0A426X8R3_ENSVE|nr:hypothetical protein B296_00054271 [Ensete ventricosum]